MQVLRALLPKVLLLFDVEGHPPVFALVCSQQQAGPLCLAVSLLLGWEYDGGDELDPRIMPLAISCNVSFCGNNVTKSHFLIAVW